MKLRLLYIIFFLVFGFSKLSTAQIDTSVTQKSSPKVELSFPDSIFNFNTKTPNPKRAGLYSALLPGLGQVYNKQYWKVGLIGAGAGVISYFMATNFSKYRQYQKAYIYRIDNNPNTPILFPEYGTDDLNLLRKGYRRYVEYTAIAATLGYTLTILDAYISAHLKSFDMSKDISLRVAPTFNPQGQFGITANFNF